MSTKIEWADEVWNPVTGCTKVSAGCANCYAERVFQRAYGRDDIPATPKSHVIESDSIRPRKFSDVVCHDNRLDKPLRWRKPRKVFVCSMGDLFHEAVPDEFIDKVFARMALCDGTRSSGIRHEFQVLTKRPRRMLDYLCDPETPFRVAAEVTYRVITGYRPSKGGCDWHTDKPWPKPNVWLGVSVENQAAADERIPLLLQTPAAVRFVSIEPMLGPIDISKFLTPSDSDNPNAGSEHSRTDGEARPEAPIPTGPANREAAAKNARAIRQGAEREGVRTKLGWAICGGESGPKARPCDLSWLRSIVDQCKFAGVPCFVKQLGSNPMGPEFHCPMRRSAIKPKDRKGGDPEEWPEDLRVREFPK